MVIDAQPSFSPPPWLVQGIERLIGTMPSVATVERHDQAVTPFQRQLGWTPDPDDHSLIAADIIHVKHGYAPTPATVAHLKALNPERVLVCGIQTDTCVLTAGFALFDAGLTPTLISDLTVGSSLDRSGELGARLWRHHFGQVVATTEL
ncbi:cysteine hydrolase family protein [Brevundimonas sp.]|uniref:cysteine hydrolase family protein n=1 Tax=Brevundimonas sp. TaxID=1871086 RepID=UPI002ED9D92D